MIHTLLNYMWAIRVFSIFKFWYWLGSSRYLYFASSNAFSIYYRTITITNHILKNTSHSSLTHHLLLLLSMWLWCNLVVANEIHIYEYLSHGSCLVLLAIHKNWNRSILGVVPSIYRNTGWEFHCADMVSISTIISDFREYRGNNS